MNTQIFGHFSAEMSSSQEYLTLNFAPTSAPKRQQRWRANGISADFLGDYFAAFFPGEKVPESAIDLKGTVKAAVSYIANELLENALKYSDDSAMPIAITLWLQEREIVFQVTNYANPATAQHYQEFVTRIDAGDVDELYLQQLEKTALGEGGSCMGILTILHDYSVRGGWHFESDSSHPSTVAIKTMIHLVV